MTLKLCVALRSKMMGIQYLACGCALVISLTGFVCGDMQFLERNQGDSVDLPCHIPPRSPPTIGFYLKRSWLRPGDVIFKYTGIEFRASNSADRSRLRVSGDPQDHAVNVSISQLLPGDTDRYFCEFVEEKPSSEDQKIKAVTEFFLLVHSDASGPADTELAQACSGGSVVLPCLAPAGQSGTVEGVILKRQRGRAPVEVAYHSKRHPGDGHSRPSMPQFPTERVQLSSAPGPDGITYNLTLQQLQPEDSAVYSCQLLLRGRTGDGGGLGRRAFFVSVQGGECSSSSYQTLLYVLSAAVGFLLLLLLLVGLVVIFKAKTQSSKKSQAPIYEEMVGVKSPTRKLPPSMMEAESCEYKNYQLKKSCPENHYESPSGALFPRHDSQKSTI